MLRKYPQFTFTQNLVEHI